MGYHFSSRLTAFLNLCLIYFKIAWALAILLEHMHKKFEINQKKIKGGFYLERKVVTKNSNSDLPLVKTYMVHVKSCLWKDKVCFGHFLSLNSLQRTKVQQTFFDHCRTTISQWCFSRIFSNKKSLAFWVKTFSDLTCFFGN